MDGDDSPLRQPHKCGETSTMGQDKPYTPVIEKGVDQISSLKLHYAAFKWRRFPIGHGLVSPLWNQKTLIEPAFIALHIPFQFSPLSWFIEECRIRSPTLKSWVGAGFFADAFFIF